MSKDTTEMVHCATIGQFTVLPLVSLSYLGEIFANPKKLI